MTVEQGSPTLGPQTGSGPWPVRNRAAQQEVSSGQVSKASSAAPHRAPSLALPPEPFLPTPAHLWKNCLPWNQSLVPKRLGTSCCRETIYLNCQFTEVFVDGKLGKSVRGQKFSKHIYHLVSIPLPPIDSLTPECCYELKSRTVLLALNIFFQSKTLPSWGFQSKKII